MAHNIESMFSSREKPWHELGKVVAGALSSEEAITAAGLDWNVNQVSITHKDKDSGYFLNYRDTDDTILGVVGSRYKIVQNKEAFNFADSLLEQDLQYETAGSLGEGKRIWLLAKMPDTSIFDDVIEPYLCLTNSHDGSGSLKVVMTPVRVVCQNTLNLALRTAERQWSVRHTTNIDSKLYEARHTLKLAQDYMESFALSAEMLHGIKIDSVNFGKLKSTLFPITGEMTESQELSQEVLQEQLQHAWDMDDLGNIRGTGWGFMNAVSDMATHKPPVSGRGNHKERVFESVIGKPEILDLAYELVNELV